MARGSVNTQPLQPMKVLEPAVASSMSDGVNTKPLQPVQAPVAPTSRKRHCTACHQRLPSGSFSSSQLRNRAAARRCQTCLQQQGILSKDEEATCREINQVFATEHRRDVSTGADVDIMLPSAQSGATKHLNAPQSSTTPTWFAKLGGDVEMVTAEAICSAHLRGTSAARIPLIRWTPWWIRCAPPSCWNAGADQT